MTRLTKLEKGEEEESGSNGGCLEESSLSALHEVPQTIDGLKDTGDQHGDDGWGVLVVIGSVLVGLEDLDDVQDPLGWLVSALQFDSQALLTLA